MFAFPYCHFDVICSEFVLTQLTKIPYLYGGPDVKSVSGDKAAEPVAEL